MQLCINQPVHGRCSVQLQTFMRHPEGCQAIAGHWGLEMNKTLSDLSLLYPTPRLMPDPQQVLNKCLLNESKPLRSSYFSEREGGRWHVLMIIIIWLAIVEDQHSILTETLPGRQAKRAFWSWWAGAVLKGACESVRNSEDSRALRNWRPLGEGCWRHPEKLSSQLTVCSPKPVLPCSLPGAPASQSLRLLRKHPFTEHFLWPGTLLTPPRINCLVLLTHLWGQNYY